MRPHRGERHTPLSSGDDAPAPTMSIPPPVSGMGSRWNRPVPNPVAERAQASVRRSEYFARPESQTLAPQLRMLATAKSAMNCHELPVQRNIAEPNCVRCAEFPHTLIPPPQLQSQQAPAQRARANQSTETRVAQEESDSRAGVRCTPPGQREH